MISPRLNSIHFQNDVKISDANRMAACMNLGSKPEAFYHDGLQSWRCSPGISSDVVVQIGDSSFHLHKFPLMSRSGKLEKLIEEYCVEDGNECIIQLHDLAGGAKAFLLVAKYCYGVKIELNASNVVGLRCASENLQMTEDYGEGNLILQSELFLKQVFASWPDTVKALETCEECLPYAEELHIVSRCIDALADKACADTGLFSWPTSEVDKSQSLGMTVFWNGICTPAKTYGMGQDWWFEDASSLKLPLFSRLIYAAESKGVKAERIAGCIMFYARRHLYLLGRLETSQNGNSCSWSKGSKYAEADQKKLLEEIVELLSPDFAKFIPARFLLKLLRTAMTMKTGPVCLRKLERSVGLQLDQAALEDLLIPNSGYSVETLYDIDCVQRILNHFMMADKESTSSCLVDESHLMGDSHSLTPMTIVASLVDGYLAEVSADENLKLLAFQFLAGVIPDYARPLDDGVYRAIDIYLKSHPWLTDSEREQLCKLMNCQKLSLEASTHAAQNERLPIRVVIQVLFFEQLRLRTSIAGWIFVSDNLVSSQEPNASLLAESSRDQVLSVDEMKQRVTELEKRCLSMKKEMEKLMKTKRGWNALCKKLGLKLKLISCDAKTKDTKTSESSNSSA